MKQLPYKYSTILIYFGILMLFIASSTIASAESSVTTNVSTTVNTGSNTVNGQTVQSKSQTKVIINGKEYVNDDSGGSHDIVDYTDNGRVEVHVNSNKSANTAPSVQGATTNKTTVTVTPEQSRQKITQKKQEIKKKIAERKEEIKEKKKSILDSVKQEIESLFASIASIFNKKK